MNEYDKEFMDAADVVLNLRHVTPKEAKTLGGEAQEFMVLECLKSEYDMPPFQNKYLRRTRTGGYGNLLVPVEDKPDKTL